MEHIVKSRFSIKCRPNCDTKLRPNFDTGGVSKFGRSFDQTSTPTSFNIYVFSIKTRISVSEESVIYFEGWLTTILYFFEQELIFMSN